MIGFFIALVLAYLLGSIPTSFIFARLFKKLDIRKHGSGNVGATNVFRIVGKWPALAVLMIDVLKGVIAVSLLADVFFNNTVGITIGFGLYRVCIGAAVISGHVWSAFLGFKGGKGVATTAGVLLVLQPYIFVGSLGVWILIFSFFRIVSIASICASIFLPILGIISQEPVGNIIFYVLLCIMGTYKHKKNIRRILRGEETKLF